MDNLDFEKDEKNFTVYLGGIEQQVSRWIQKGNPTGRKELLVWKISDYQLSKYWQPMRTRTLQRLRKCSSVRL